MSTATALQTADAAVLVQLAAAAAGDLSLGPVLPAGWSPLATLPANPVAPTRSSANAQGFLAYGALPSTGAAVAVLALGVPWVVYLNQVLDGSLVLTDLPVGTMPAGGAPQVIGAFSTFYAARRSDIWSNLGRLKGAPLLIVGMGLGAPLAQIAAIDLRPDNAGPNKEPPPRPAPVCWTFSAPAVGNADFAAAFGQKVSTQWSVTLASAGVAIDTFPVPSGLADGVLGAGRLSSVPSSLPPGGDDAWVERSPGFYAAALGSPLPPPPAQPPAVASWPAGFDPLLAWSLARLCQLPTQLAQHPGLLIPGAPAPFRLEGIVPWQGGALAAVLTSPIGTVVAFRGSNNFEEFAGVLSNSTLMIARFIAGENAYVHGGALGVYTGNNGAVQSALLALLNKVVPANPPLVFTGHDLGGALAVLAAADVAVNAPALGQPFVYTFGSIPVGSATLPLVLPNFPLWAVARPGDPICRAMLNGGYDQVGTPVGLPGTPPNDEPSRHALSGYASLLNPWG